jgi:hypothetical protein
MHPISSVAVRRFAPALVAGALIALAAYGLWSVADQVVPGAAPGAAPHRFEPVTHALVLVMGLTPLMAVIWFLYLFGGVEMRPGRLGQIIVFCYLGTGVMIIGSLLPFVALPLAPGLQKLMADSPVGVTPGCRLSADQEPVPKEIACSSHAEQWLVNIGGIMEPASPAPAGAAAGLPQATASAQSGPPPADSRDRRSPTGWPAAQIRGGLVVPLYFVVLSLIGAAISMTRGVPDCQRRLIPGRPDSMTPEDARGYLVLQIMQVLSAPLIAIVAYYALEPDAPRTAVLLGFACGFASETILLMISASLKKLKPDGPPPEPPAPASGVSAGGSQAGAGLPPTGPAGAESATGAVPGSGGTGA